MHDTVLRRDVWGGPGTEWVFPYGIMADNGTVLLKAQNCTEWMAGHYDSLSFDFDGDGRFDSVGCVGQTVEIRSAQGLLLASLGGSEPSLPHRLTNLSENGSWSCYDASISYPRLDTADYGNSGEVNLTLRVANGGEIAQNESQVLQFEVLGTAGWVNLGIPTTVRDLGAKTYGDVTIGLNLANLTAQGISPLQLRATLGEGEIERDIDPNNQSLEIPLESLWP